MPKILFLWLPNERLRNYLAEGCKSLKDVNLIFPENKEETTLLKHAVEVDIMVGWRPTEKLLMAAKKLQLFINPGAGVQHQISLFKKIREAKKNKITLVNGHGNAYFTAQHAVALLLTLSNKIITHHQLMQGGKWRTGDKEARSIPLRRQRIGLLGYGAVNQKVHRFLSGFELTFSALRTNWEAKQDSSSFPTAIRQYLPNQLADFLQEIDVLIIALPLTKHTKHLIGLKELGLLGKKGLLVNIARGSIIKEKALFTALKERKIAGAAIDVWYEYQPKADESNKKYPYQFPFYELDNIVLSPHRAASPMNDLERWNEVIENIRRFANSNNDFLNVVNLEKEY